MLAAEQRPLAGPSAAHIGLALGALFGWLLTFPFFGPLLFAVTGGAAPTLGLLFVFTQGGALLLFAFMPKPLLIRPGLGRWAGSLLAIITLFYAAAPVIALRFATETIIAMALLTAYLTILWSGAFARTPDPIGTIITGMGGAYLMVAGISAAQAGAPAVKAIGLALVAALVLYGANAIDRLIQTPGQPEPTARVPARPLQLDRYLPGIFFALGTFFVAGLWYHILSATPGDEWQWRPVVEALLYSLGIILIGDRARRDRPATIALYSLSLLGIALMVATLAAGGLDNIYRGFFLLGRAAGDLFYWHYIWRVQRTIGARKAVGLGWGYALILIALANLTSASLGTVMPSPIFLLTGAALLFLIIPTAARDGAQSEPVPSSTNATTAAPVAPQPGESAASPLAPPTSLTQSERAVYDLLIKGAGDAEIATTLYISRHTVKFHVRNILHKVGVENRKELLSRLVNVAAGETDAR